LIRHRHGYIIQDCTMLPPAAGPRSLLPRALARVEAAAGRRRLAAGAGGLAGGRHRHRGRSGLALAGLLAAAAWAVSCDKAPLTAPTGSVITLFASTSVVPVGGTAEITASVIEQAGTPVQNGTQVTFTTSLGTIDPPEARTRDGKVTVRFLAGMQSGTATISAFSGGANSGTGGGNGAGRAATIDIKVGGAAASRLVLSAAPTSVPETGGTVQLVATVLDESGNRLPGVPVTFTATAGQLGQTTVVSNANGEAHNTIVTNQQAQVTASAGGSARDTVTVTVSSSPTITVTPSAAPVAGAAVTFTVTVGRGDSGTAIREVTIDFGDGDRLSLGAFTGTTSVSHVYQDPGTYIVTGTATNVNGNRTSMSTSIVVSSQSLTVNVTAAGTGTVGSAVTISVTVSASSGAVPAIVRFTYDFGDGTTAVLNSSSTSHVYSSDGRKVIRVTVLTADGRTATGQTEIVIRP
jgi:PKD repeat protein